MTKKPLQILFDQNLLSGKTLYSRLGVAKPFQGRTLTHEQLKDVDLLFTRSTTKLTRELITDTSLKFVGSGVAGTDHIDFEAFKELGIPVVSAPGCNAESVANFFISALLCIGERQNRTWEGATLGIVGVGHVGKLVWKFAEQALGLKVIGCDPPRQRNFLDVDAKNFVPYETVLEQSDIITFHVPLIKDGSDKTQGLFSGKIVRKVKPDAVLFNMSRGTICDDALIDTMLNAGLLSDAVIDCWENEPDYSPELAASAALTTPHIAGHAYEGRVNGTIATYRSACDFLNIPYGRNPAAPKSPVAKLTLQCAGLTDEQILRKATQAACNVEADSARFRAAFNENSEIRKRNFDTLRKTYPLRRLFSATTLTLEHPSKTITAKLKSLGFKIAAKNAHA